MAWNKPVPFLMTNLTTNLRPLVATPELARWSLFSADLPADQVAAHTARLSDESYLAYLGMMLIPAVRPRPDVPVLVIGAEDDHIFRPAAVRRTARAYGTQAVFFPHMAHDMMLEAGWEAVAARIVGWLGECGL